MELTMLEAANLLGITRQAIHWAMVAGRLPGIKNANGRIKIERKDVEFYKKTRFNRKYTTKHNGVNAYSDEKGKLSLKMASELTGIPRQHFYYLVRMGALSFEKVGCEYVINKDELLKYAKYYVPGEIKAVQSA